MVYENCSELVSAFAVLGGIFLYALIGLVIGLVVRQFLRDGQLDDDEVLLVVLSVIFWPIAIVVGIFYVIGAWVTAPLWAASRSDLRRTEDRLSRKIDNECIGRIGLSNIVAVSSKPSFKVGDIITGIVPQTDSDGENISYKHLYQGCRCRILRIDEDDSMKVILIGHKDKEAHGSYIGETFTAPARNFTLVRKPAKRKPVKKKSKR